MIYVVSALKCEIAPLEKKFEDCGIKFILTGVGREHAAKAVADIKFHPEDYVVNIGVCAGDAPGIYLANRITDMVDGKDYYPDLRVKHDIPERHLFTSGKVVSFTAPGVIYDMEASAIFRVAQRHITVEKMYFVKIVSDNGQNLPTASQVSKLIEKYIPQTADLLSQISRAANEAEREEFVKEQIDYAVATVAPALCLSETMESDYKKLVTYAAAVGKLDEVTAFWEDKLDRGCVPVKSKKEGARYVGELKKLIPGA